MNEPLGWSFTLAEAAGAVEPEAVALAVLDYEVVALRNVAGGLAPPFRGNAFRPLRPRHLVANAAPAELPRRSFRDQGHDLGGLGAWQQEEGAQCGRGIVARPLPLSPPGRARADGAFGDVALVRVELAHNVGAEALLQAVYELVQGLGRGSDIGHGEVGLATSQRLGD
jgi:hypothetical protein